MSVLSRIENHDALTIDSINNYFNDGKNNITIAKLGCRINSEEKSFYYPIYVNNQEDSITQNFKNRFPIGGELYNNFLIYYNNTLYLKYTKN